MTEILKFCDSRFNQEGGLAPIASLPPPLRASPCSVLGVSGEAVVAAARAWLGTPFRHQGRVKGVGCDCLGLLIGVAAELDLPQAALDERIYGHYPDGGYLQRRLEEALQPEESPAPGRIGLFAIDGVARHLGIFGSQKPDQASDFRLQTSGFPTLIHAYAPARKVVEHRFGGEWREKLVKIFAISY